MLSILSLMLFFLSFRLYRANVGSLNFGREFDFSHFFCVYYLALTPTSNESEPPKYVWFYLPINFYLYWVERVGNFLLFLTAIFGSRFYLTTANLGMGWSSFFTQDGNCCVFRIIWGDPTTLTPLEVLRFLLGMWVGLSDLPGTDIS